MKWLASWPRALLLAAAAAVLTWLAGRRFAEQTRAEREASKAAANGHAAGVVEAHARADRQARKAFQAQVSAQQRAIDLELLGHSGLAEAIRAANAKHY